MSENGVAAVDRALSILACFDVDSPTKTLAELATRTGLYKSTVLRLAASLQKANFLRRFDDGSFELGPAVLRLGEIYQQSFDFGKYVMPVLQALAAETGESASFYVREGDVRTCLFRVHSTSHRVLHFVMPGSQLDLKTGAAGRILLAFTEPDRPEFEAERQELVTVSDRNRQGDTTAIASPVFGARGFLGALSLAGPRFRFEEETVDRMRDVVRSAAKRLTEQLGGAFEPVDGRARPGRRRQTDVGP